MCIALGKRGEVIRVLLAMKAVSAISGGSVMSRCHGGERHKRRYEGKK